MSNLSSEFCEYEVDDLETLMGDGSEPQIHTGDEFDLHPQSESTVDSLDDLRRLCHIPPKVEMIVSEPFESPESGREGYCCAYEIYFKECGLFFPLPEILLTYLNHLGIAFSQMSPNMLRYLLCTFTVAAEAGHSLGLCELLELFQARESRTSGYYALYPIADRSLIDSLPLKDNAWRMFWFFFRINSFTTQSSSELLRVNWSLNLGPQIRPAPSIDFLNFYKAVLERPVNWNSFTLERIHGAGFSVRMGLTNPVDPPPAGIDLSSLNARDRRKLKEANKKIKDQISLVGRDKKNATSTGDDKQKLETALADHNFAKGEIELLRSEFIKVKAAAEELERKNEFLSELKDRDVRKISHDARKEVKGAGQKFLLAVQEFIAADKAWNKLNSERDEMKSNLDLIKEIEDGKVNLAEEKETVCAELAETEAKLNTAPQPYLNLQQFASEFADSPPLTEPNIGSSLDETMLTGSPSAHFNEFGTNVDRISSGRAQGPSDQGLVTSSIMGDEVESRNETPQDVSSLNPEVVLTTQDDDVGGALVSSQAREEGDLSMASSQGEPSDSNPPRFPSAETLFPPGDGFTPQGVAIPCFLPSMSREEKIECHEFMEQITERYVFLCSERQRLGRKRRILEERIARTERKIRRLESDVHNWERRGFDSIARIPSCLREHIRFLKKHWDIYQRSLKPVERESGNSSEKHSDSFKLISDDLPGAPDIELAKTGRAGEPEGSRILRKGTSIQLITRHDELEDEKKEIRKKRGELRSGSRVIP
ncbi:hypothetical protein ISN45_Aa02g011100 [Arabidopsis thaliana x Arabidopsis arenosa]|uniref:Uncharacterized protein n=1 Tax=Arabidopsis thaliana x Arabidopsis arenosa TaxID=1240361 RepID=A0A8T2BIN0_9BRAS|nr:hypothetical protein ISN45_Aa02g011100 [Arabidopsis thaliana x Arabidopsis arenosa]